MSKFWAAKDITAASTFEIDDFYPLVYESASGAALRTCISNRQLALALSFSALGRHRHSNAISRRATLMCALYLMDPRTLGRMVHFVLRKAPTATAPHPDDREDAFRTASSTPGVARDFNLL